MERGVFKSCLIVLLIISLLAACSRVDLAYRNLDRLIPWRLNQYLALDAEQKRWLQPRLQKQLTWHCSAELQRYIDWLQRSEQLFLADPEPQQLLAQFAEFDTAIGRLYLQVTPDATELLQGLSPEQVSHLRQTMDRRNQEDHQEYVEPPAATLLSQRSARMEKRLRPWLGPLNDAQKMHVQNWAQRLEGQSSLWLDNRKHWQQQLLDALQHREQADFAERLRPLLEERESLYTEPYRQAASNSRLALAQLFSDLLASAEPEQRQRLSKRLTALREDLEVQRCS
jgi:hypothetical protein